MPPPRRAQQQQPRHAGPLGGEPRGARDLGGERVGGVDQPVDPVLQQIGGEPGRAAEPADPDLAGDRAGMAGPPGQRRW